MLNSVLPPAVSASEKFAGPPVYAVLQAQLKLPYACLLAASPARPETQTSTDYVGTSMVMKACKCLLLAALEWSSESSPLVCSTAIKCHTCTGCCVKASLKVLVRCTKPRHKEGSRPYESLLAQQTRLQSGLVAHPFGPRLDFACWFYDAVANTNPQNLDK